MYKSPNSSIFQKQNNRETNENQEGICFSRDSFSKLGYQIVDLEKKMDSFGAMDEVEEEILCDLNRNGQRIDALVSKLRTFLKLQPQQSKDRKSTSFSSYSPSGIQSQLKQKNHKTNNQQPLKNNGKGMRLKDRVQKALQQQEIYVEKITKQPKYIK